eukprot:scaffold1264_cov80-Skeletonema_menzelii.AAC.1
MRKNGFAQPKVWAGQAYDNLPILFSRHQAHSAHTQAHMPRQCSIAWRVEKPKDFPHNVGDGIKIGRRLGRQQ